MDARTRTLLRRKGYAGFPPPIELPDGSTCISPEQRRVHERTELLSVVVTVPFFLYLIAKQKPLSMLDKGLLAALVGGIIAVDGGLYRSFKRTKKA